MIPMYSFSCRGVILFVTACRSVGEIISVPGDLNDLKFFKLRMYPQHYLRSQPMIYIELHLLHFYIKCHVVVVPVLGAL